MIELKYRPNDISISLKSLSVASNRRVIVLVREVKSRRDPSKKEDAEMCLEQCLDGDIDSNGPLSMWGGTFSGLSTSHDAIIFYLSD